jgi:general secretion pathway protein G
LNETRAHIRGFTLIEVLLVLAILGILATVGIVALSGTREGAKIDATKVLLTDIETALEAFNVHVNRYPTADEGLAGLLTKPAFEDETEASQWRGPYLKREAKDVWGQAINYEPVEAGSQEYTRGLRYKLWSNGPDKQSGTEDDIKNWSEEEAGT